MTDSDPTSQAQRSWAAMRAVVTERSEKRKEVCEALGMSFGRIRLLRQLMSGPLCLRDLAAALNTDAPYTTIMVGDLQRRGLVVRTLRPGNRRTKVVSLTAQGDQTAVRAETMLGAPPAALYTLDPADLADLDRILSVLVNRSQLPIPSG
jgi:DNA-binding MarR family transcriptional regulator